MFGLWLFGRFSPPLRRNRRLANNSSSNIGSIHDTVCAARGNSVEFPPVEVKVTMFLVEFLPSSGAIRRIEYALVAPPGGQVTN